MISTRSWTHSWKAVLVLLGISAISGCLGAQPGAPGSGPSAAAGGDIAESAFKGAAPDEAASGPKPLPGGAVGTGDSWGDDAAYAAQGSATRCEETQPSRTGGVAVVLKTTVSGQLVAIDEGKKAVGPAGPPTVSYLRFMDVVDGAAVGCTDLKLDEALTFDGDVSISQPANLKLILFMVPLIGFGNVHPDCDAQYDPLKVEHPPKLYQPVKNELDVSALNASDTPQCPKRTSMSGKRSG